MLVAESGNEHQQFNLAFHSFLLFCNCLLRKASERSPVFFSWEFSWEFLSVRQKT